MYFYVITKWVSKLNGSKSPLTPLCKVGNAGGYGKHSIYSEGWRAVPHKVKGGLGGICS